MVNRKWTNREINEALQRLGASYELPPERSAALESRIRREVIARYGRFDVPLRGADSRQPIADSRQVGGARYPQGAFRWSGMLNILRPAFVFAVLGVLIVGGVVAMRRLGGTRSMPSVEPVGSSVSVVAVAEPVLPGSGVGVSVFSADSRQPIANSPSSSSTRANVRRSGARRLNPAAGVFSQWGESVFSEEELLRSERDGKNVYFPNS